MRGIRRRETVVKGSFASPFPQKPQSTREEKVVGEMAESFDGKIFTVYLGIQSQEKLRLISITWDNKCYARSVTLSI